MIENMEAQQNIDMQVEIENMINKKNELDENNLEKNKRYRVFCKH